MGNAIEDEEQRQPRNRSRDVVPIKDEGDQREDDCPRSELFTRNTPPRYDRDALTHRHIRHDGILGEVLSAED